LGVLNAVFQPKNRYAVSKNSPKWLVFGYGIIHFSVLVLTALKLSHRANGKTLHDAKPTTRFSSPLKIIGRGAIRFSKTVPTFAGSRCFVPAGGFYDWKKLAPKTKQPMFIHFPDERAFGFAGLWERWKPSEDAEPLDTCTIITTKPNTLMSSIHDRMPVILKPEDYGKWLGRETDPHEAEKLLRPYPDGELEAVPVDRLVNSPKNDLPSCIEPLA
jgi:hypothetical protein